MATEVTCFCCSRYSGLRPEELEPGEDVDQLPRLGVGEILCKNHLLQIPLRWEQSGGGGGGGGGGIEILMFSCCANKDFIVYPCHNC